MQAGRCIHRSSTGSPKSVRELVGSSIPVSETSSSLRKSIKRRRRVYFAGEPPSIKIIENTTMYEPGRKSELFCRGSDLMKYRASAAKVAQSVFDQDDEEKDSTDCYSFVMWEAFDACRTAAIVNSDDVPENVKDALERWVRKGMSRRGLEKWSIPALSGDRRECKDKAIHCVLRMQTKSFNGIKMKDHPELIAKVYEQLSKPATLFSRLMGEADAMANESSTKVQRQRGREGFGSMKKTKSEIYIVKSESRIARTRSASPRRRRTRRKLREASSTIVKQ